MEIKLQGQQSYPAIINGLTVAGGIDYITQLNMPQIKVLCTQYLFYLMEKNDDRTDWSYKDETGMIIKESDEVLKETAKRYGYDRFDNWRELSIKKERVKHLQQIISDVLQLYKACKISYKRKGREEGIGKALRGLQEEETRQKQELPMNSDK